MSLVLEQVNFSYSDTPVLKDVSLRLEKGDFLGLLGPNGSGKSTLLKLLTGILHPRSGSIDLHGHPLGSLSRRALAQTIAYVPQEANWIFPFTVREVVSMGRVPFVQGMGYGSSHDEAVVMESMGRVDIAQLADKTVTALSGGERQRVLVARALAQTPEILVLDEPNAHLDLTHQAEMFEILRGLNEERAVSIVCVSHDLNLAAMYCRSLAFLSMPRGESMGGNTIVAMGSVDDVFTRQNLEEVFATPLSVDRHPTINVPRVTLNPPGAGASVPPRTIRNHR